MPLLPYLIGFIFIKGFFQLPFYYKYTRISFKLALFTSLAIAPLITILYHETELDFWFVYFSMMGIDIFLYLFFIQKNWWKAIPAAFLINTILMIFFYIGNGWFFILNYQNVKRFLLDVKADPVLFEKNNSNNTWLIVVAVVALLAIVGFFIWKRRSKK